MARKDVAFKIRVEEELRRAFIDLCRREDRPAAQVIRQFMRDYVETRQRDTQRDLFEPNGGNSA